MVKITYIEARGAKHVVEVQPGVSVMQGAVWNGIPGIVAECSGNCACGTCRVYVDEAWRERSGEPSAIEEATMEIRDDPQQGKRLSCQIKVTEELDGLVIRMPESQW
ncbi:MAG: 2Fe-2S iron-sulfur cluster-binding protein [Rhizomicrobium sp.]